MKILRESKVIKNICVLLICLLIAICFNYNIIFNLKFEPDDLLFHFNRILTLDKVFSSPTNLDVFAHMGKVINIFYPWITLLPILIFKMLMPLKLAWKMYIILITMVGLFLTYYASKKLTKNKIIAIIITFIYIFDKVNLTNLLVRGALGEFIGYLLFPMVILYAYKLIILKEINWYKLPIILTIIGYSHVLSLLSSILVIGIIFFIDFIFNFKKYNFKIWINFLYNALLFLILMLIIIVPIMEQYKEQALFTTFNWLPSPMNIKTFISSGLNLNVFPINGHLPISINLIIFSLLPILMIKFIEIKMLPILVVSYVLILLILGVVPWTWLNHTVLKNYQFITRLQYYSIYTIILVTFIGFKNFLSLYQNKVMRITIWTVIGILVLITTFIFAKINYSYTKLTNITSYESIIKRMDYWKYPDYVSISREKGANINEPPKWIFDKENEFKMSTNNSINKNWKIEDNKFSTTFENQNQNNNIILNMNYYKGLKYKINNKIYNGSTENIALDGRLKIQIPYKGTTKLSVYYEYTILTRSIQIITVIIWILLLGYIYKMKCFKNRK